MQDFKNPDLFSIFKSTSDTLKRKRENNVIEYNKLDKKVKIESEDPLKILEEIKLSTFENDLPEKNLEEEKIDLKNNKKYLLEDFAIETFQEDCGCVHEIVCPKNFPRNGTDLNKIYSFFMSFFNFMLCCVFYFFFFF